MFTRDVLFIASQRDADDRGTTAVTVTGPLVLRTARELQHVLHHALLSDVRRLNVDLSGVTDVDPAGLATLVVAARRLQARPNGSLLQLTAVSGVCADTMRHLHLFGEQLAALE